MCLPIPPRVLVGYFAYWPELLAKFRFGRDPGAFAYAPPLGLVVDLPGVEPGWAPYKSACPTRGQVSTDGGIRTHKRLVLSQPGLPISITSACAGTSSAPAIPATTPLKGRLLPRLYRTRESNPVLLLVRQRPCH